MANAVMGAELYSVCGPKSGLDWSLGGESKHVFDWNIRGTAHIVNANNKCDMIDEVDQWNQYIYIPNSLLSLSFTRLKADG